MKKHLPSLASLFCYAPRRQDSTARMLALAGLVLLTLLPGGALAATITKKAGTANLNVGNSWIGSTVPGAADTASWNSGTTGASSGALGTNLNFASITFSSPSGNQSIGGSGGWTLTLGTGGIDMSNPNRSFTINCAIALGGAQTWTVCGYTLVLNGVVSGTNGLTLNATGGQVTLSGANTYSGGTTLNGGTLNLNYGSSSSTNNSAIGTNALTINSGVLDNTSGSGVTLGSSNPQYWNADFTFVGSNPLSLHRGPVTLNSNRVVTVNASYLTVNGIVSGNNYSLTKAGAGTFTLGGSNIFSGGVVLSSGQLNINNAQALGTTNGTFTIVSGALANTVISNAITTLNYPQAWNGDFTFANANSDLHLGSGAVTLGGNRQVTVSDHQLTVGGVIGGSYSMTKAGNGTLTLSGVNTYSGNTTVSAGTLLVNGSLASGSAVTVSYGATLGGTGAINGAATVNAGGDLSPGAGIGTLTFGSSLTLSGVTSMEINKTAGTADKIVMSSGTVTLGGTLSVTNLAGTLTNGDTFDLIDGNIAGSFSALNLPTPPAGLQWNTSQLTVNGNISVEIAPPTISGQPTNTTLHAGATATLNVSATGLNLSYQWRRNGVNLAGATNTTLTLTSVQFTNAGLYDVVISNPTGSVTSGLTRVTVWTPGGVVAWGWNTNGQADVPAGLTNAVGLAGGYAHSLALLDGGTVLGWGNNSDGQTNTPAGLSNVVAIAAGDYHNLALKADGTVVAWGWNTNGQTDVPADLTNVVAIAAGYNYSLALKNDHRVVAWGVNDYGQTNVPADLTNAVGIAADDNHSLALRGGGTVTLWGAESQTNVPSGLSNNVVVAGGITYDAVVGNDGGVFA